MRWSWPSFGIGLCLGLLAVGLVATQAPSTPPAGGGPRAAAPVERAPDEPGESPTQSPAARHVGPTTRPRRATVSEPAESVPSPRMVGVPTSETEFEWDVVFEEAVEVSFGPGGGSTRASQPAEMLARCRAGARAAAERGDVSAAALLAGPTYAERAIGLGLAASASSPRLDLLLAAASDAAFPDLRGAALHAAFEAAPEDERIRALVLDAARGCDADLRRAALEPLRALGAEGAAVAAELLRRGDYDNASLGALALLVAAHGDATRLLAARPPFDAAAAVVAALEGCARQPHSDAERELLRTLPDLARSVCERPDADDSVAPLADLLARLGAGGHLRALAASPFVTSRVRVHAIRAALADAATRADGVASVAALLNERDAPVALVLETLGLLPVDADTDPELAGALVAAATSHPSAWVREAAASQLAGTSVAHGALVVHSGTYGAQGKDVDVTAALLAALEGGRLVVRASNGLAGDPNVGVVKTLRVEYSVDGVRRLAEVREGAVLRLP